MALFCGLVRALSTTWVRRGWISAPDGWVQFIFGSRPRTKQWSLAGRNQSAAKPKSPLQKPPQPTPNPGRWRQNGSKKSTDVVVEEAKKRVPGFEAALAALAQVGDAIGPEVQLLQDALRNVKRAAQESAISVQIAQLEFFLERPKKRLESLGALRADGRRVGQAGRACDTIEGSGRASTAFRRRQARIFGGREGRGFASKASQKVCHKMWRPQTAAVRMAELTCASVP